MTTETERLARILWDYLCMHQQIEKADAILALGSHDVRVAHRAAELLQKGFAPYIIFSGGFGRLTGDFPKAEAEVFADAAISDGVSPDKIIIENRSTNTGENIKFSFELLAAKKLFPKKILLVTKPYMERRAYATFKKLEPGIDIIATSPAMDLEHCEFDGFSKEDIINIMVGDMQRVKIYPERGYQIPQDIPDEVWQAFEKLVKLGFNEQLVRL